MRFIAALFLSLALAFPVQAEVRLSRDQAVVLANRLLGDAQYSAAREISQGLLIRDDQDLEAQLILSVAQRNLGNFKDAAKAGKAAWRIAETDSRKYDAALLTAQALASGGAHSTAQIWLRRAAQIAPNEKAKNTAVQDLKFVRSQNPWSYNFRFSLRPSDNINNGSNSDVVVIGGIPLLISGRNKPLSGIGLTLGAEAEYLKRLSSTQSLRYGVDFETRQYALSDEAKSIAPDAKGSDYAFSSAKFHVAYDITVPDKRNAHSFEAQIGRYRYGGEPLSNLIWLKYSFIHRQKDGTQNQFAVVGEDNSRLDNHARDTGKVSVFFRRSKATKSGGVFSWNLTASTTRLTGDQKYGQATDLANDAIGGGIRYTWAKPFFGATTSLALQYEGQRFDQSRYVYPDVREDHRGIATLSMFFNELEYYGFAPVLDVGYERKYSNASLFSVDSFGVNIGIRSSF